MVEGDREASTQGGPDAAFQSNGARIAALGWPLGAFAQPATGLPLVAKAEGAIVIVAQRLHQDDLIGHVLEQDDWEVVSIPAIEEEDKNYRLGLDPRDVYCRRAGEVLHPEREPRAALDVLRRTLGSMNFSAQYLQNPLPQDGNIIKREWIRHYAEAPDSFDLVIASWDTASTEGDASDYSVGTVWGLKDATFYLLEVSRTAHSRSSSLTGSAGSG